MADSDKGEREALLTTIRARRKWYLGIYALQILGWLIIVIINQVIDIDNTAPITQRIQDAAIAMTFIAQGTLISTVLLIDVVFDGTRYIVKKGVEFMGLLFDNFENKFVVRGRKQGIEQGIGIGIEQGIEQGIGIGIEQGIEQSKDKLNTWVEENPEVKKLIEEGKVTMPLERDNDESQR